MASLNTLVEDNVNVRAAGHFLNHTNSGHFRPEDSWFHNLTNKEELIQRWAEKLKRDKATILRLDNTTTEITETDLSFPPDSLWPLLWIALYAVVVIIIIVVAIKACILLFEKTDITKFDETKDSPNILRMAVAGNVASSSTTGALSRFQLHNEILNISSTNYNNYENDRSISPRLVVGLQALDPGMIPNSTSPCCIYSNNHNPNNLSGNTSSWSHHNNFTNISGCGGNSRRLLQSHGRGVSLEAEFTASPCTLSTGSCRHHNHHHHSQQQLHTCPIPVTNSGTRYQKQYQYQHQHSTNDSSLQWDSMNTNNTEHSGESPPSYEIALGVEIASRPQSAGNCSEKDNNA